MLLPNDQISGADADSPVTVVPASSRSARFELLRARHMGMCFGVRDAIHLALAQPHPEKLTVWGELVHNETVLRHLREHGIRTANHLETVQTPAVMVTAHGTSNTAVQQARERGFDVLEATCPLVRFAHSAVLQLEKTGYYPVIIGKRDHVEVRGLVGDLKEFHVVLTPEEIDAVPEHPRFGVASQTTQPVAKVRELAARLQARYPSSEVKLVDTVCRPTKQRQQSARELAQACDVIVVVGGARSNNTRELAAACGNHGARVHHVQEAADLRPEWFEDARKVGLTAGTSTPDEVIDAVEQALLRLAQAAPAPILA